jgi:hypothetical protein
MISQLQSHLVLISAYHLLDWWNKEALAFYYWQPIKYLKMEVIIWTMHKKEEIWFRVLTGLSRMLIIRKCKSYLNLFPKSSSGKKAQAIWVLNRCHLSCKTITLKNLNNLRKPMGRRVDLTISHLVVQTPFKSLILTNIVAFTIRVVPWKKIQPMNKKYSQVQYQTIIKIKARVDG